MQKLARDNYTTVEVEEDLLDTMINLGLVDVEYILNDNGEKVIKDYLDKIREERVIDYELVE